MREKRAALDKSVEVTFMVEVVGRKKFRSESAELQVQIALRVA
jgi:hypothetical protein